MSAVDVGATWAGTHTFRAAGLVVPRTIDEAAELVASHERIRAFGTRHSFNDLADGETLISMLEIDPGFELDERRAEVTVGTGTRYGVLAAWLHERGWALKNMGSLPHISIGGANATATHGSGDRNGVLATSIAAIELITAGGEIRRIARGDEGFEGSVVSLGALGVAARVTLDVVPAFDMRQDVFHAVPWEAVLEHLGELTGCGYSVSVFTIWDEPALARVLVKSRIDDGAPEELFGVRAARPAPPEPLDNRTPQGGAPGPWLERLPHFRLDRVPSNGDEIQSEYFVDRAHGSAAIAAVRELAADIAPCLITTELRTTAADELWLSMAHGRASLGIHFTWRNLPAEVHALIPRIEAALAPFAARTHWGKVHAMTADRIRPLYPRMPDFLALRERMDPARKFDNAHLRRVLGT
ncbi:xylitol oxidase [Microbacterium nanhaiense]|uniref:Xylitol oxidase n=1 Tax=Microbacterium nanhaiense TaxID=1301026 RepID=A0ABQ2MWC0_9MICO|nr:D-arabinono-1,4-lactone oxidase [Microbacterium nanhaiense]GGO58739.1 xylitol oxidase [Microbacterium nanhaiense]